jgi:hypothetical protein
MSKKTIPIKEHKRSKPADNPRKNPDSPKPGPKTVPVKKYNRTPPSS